MLESMTGSKASETVEVILPRTIRLTERSGEVEMIAFFDGIGGWIKSPWGADNLLPSWQRDAAQQELMRQLERLLLSDHDKQTTVEYVKSEEVSGRRADVLEIPSPTGGKLRLTTDSTSGDVLTLECPRIGPRGIVATVTDFYGDYRRTPNGLRVPFKIQGISDGRPYMQTVITEVEYNQGLRANVLSGQGALGIE